jgi:protein gp37
MGDKTGISWTGSTWTPIRARYDEIQSDGSGKERVGWHCEHVSEACRFCYAEAFNRRLGTGRDFKPAELFREEQRGYNLARSWAARFFAALDRAAATISAGR